MISDRMYHFRIPAVLVQAVEDATALAQRGGQHAPELKRHDELMAHRRRRFGRFSKSDMVRLLIVEGLESRGWQFSPDGRALRVAQGVESPKLRV